MDFYLGRESVEFFISYECLKRDLFSSIKIIGCIRDNLRFLF